MMNVLVVGGAGYVGTELLYHLSGRKEIAKIVVYDNFSRANYNLFIGNKKLDARKIQFIQGELLDSRKLRKTLKGIDVVYHLAAKVSTPFSGESSHHFEQTNNWGSAELVYAIEDSEVQQLIYTSSLSVYGASSNVVNENTPLFPKTFYGISKMRGEEHINRLASKIKVHTLRCANIYGYSKSMRFDSVINKFMFDAHYNHRISINGNGNQKRSFIHINNVSSVLSKLLNNSIESGIYNLSDKVLSINDIAEALTEIYPEMEMLFVNQHIQLRELIAQENTNINSLFSEKRTVLKDDLVRFKENFTF